MTLMSSISIAVARQATTIVTTRLARSGILIAIPPHGRPLIGAPIAPFARRRRLASRPPFVTSARFRGSTGYDPTQRRNVTMSEQDWLAERFEEHRTRLRAVAYRMLGSLSEADDAVQEAWVRLSRADAEEIENLGGWLTTVVGRVSLNMLRSRGSRREESLGPHVPEPIVDSEDGTAPEHEALLADSVGLALLVVLETLTPPERLAFVLHDVFAVPFDEIAPLIDRSPEAARQLASRARRRVQAQDTVPDTDLDGQREIVEAFMAAAHDGDFERLVAVLDP